MVKNCYLLQPSFSFLVDDMTLLLCILSSLQKKATQTEYSREDCISFLLKGIFPHMYSAFATGAICKTHNGNSPITINAKMVIKKETMVGREQGCVLLCKRHKKPNFMTHFLTTIRQKIGFSIKYITAQI